MQLDKNLVSFASLASPLLPPTKDVTVQISRFLQGEIKLGVFVDVQEIWKLLFWKFWVEVVKHQRLRRPVGEATWTQTKQTPNLTRPSYQEVSTPATLCLAIPNGNR